MIANCERSKGSSACRLESFSLTGRPAGNVGSEDRAEFALYRMDDARLAPSIRI
jgi:hypothetical protein